jgi:hypothetical protein
LPPGVGGETHTVRNVMAEDKKGKKPAGDEFTTVRIFEEDGSELSELSSMDGVMIAKAYETHVRPVIRKLLKEKYQERLKKMG